MEQKLNDIAQELAGLQVQYFQWKNQVNSRLETLEKASIQANLSTLNAIIASLENRVKELEEARQRQIAVNTELLKKPEPAKFNFLDFFKRK